MKIVQVSKTSPVEITGKNDTLKTHFNSKSLLGCISATYLPFKKKFPEKIYIQKQQKT